MSNQTLAEFQSYVKEKKVAVLGAGISNRPLIRWLYPLTGKIHVFDQLTEEDEILKRTINDFAAEGLELNWSLGPDYLENLKGFDLIFRTPFMRPDLPRLVAERARGARVTSEMELFLELCPAPVTAVTGSDGKTTTTTLISLMLKQAGHKVYIGGNIGTPLLDQIGDIKSSDQVVVELSSFQLIDMKAKIHTAVITNVAPNHLDYHPDFAEYCSAKKNIFRLQDSSDILILNANDAESKLWAKEAKAEVRFFNCDNSEAPHSWLDDKSLKLRTCADDLEFTLLSRDEVLLPGRFNLDNIQAAVLATLDSAGFEDMQMVAKTFRGVQHRLEWIRRLDGADWYNSSIDTSPDRALKTLEALCEQGKDIVLITGGKDKNSNYEQLGKAIVNSTSRIVFVGDNAPLIEASVIAAAGAEELAKLEIRHCDSYREAVESARDLSLPGDAVVLSPAGTSFDFFRHFEERGDTFRQLVLAEKA
ncbi:MAG: UDP-N-acetylmuramoyl-L-alanine--D-glutamate ligase [Clostridiaceae bacterium]|nr:UDP-N-acetylmuramoyl-L-alanine--D-glutamate ligase [Clostridiaceae bacterium]